jgi:hypothetical protein
MATSTAIRQARLAGYAARCASFLMQVKRYRINVMKSSSFSHKGRDRASRHVVFFETQVCAAVRAKRNRPQEIGGRGRSCPHAVWAAG